MQDKFSVQQWLTLTVFLLKILWSLLDLGQCLSNKLRNVFATLVVTFLLKGRSNRMVLRLRFRFWVFCSSLWNFNSAFWYLLFFKAVSCSDFVSLKISSLDKFLFNLLLIGFGMCLMTWVGWLEDVLTYNKDKYNKGSLGFLCGRYKPFVRLKVTSKKLTILKFVLISILNPTSLTIFITFFNFWSIFCLLTLRSNIKASSWYKPELPLSIMFTKRNNS